MQEIYVEDLKKILVNKSKLEKELSVKITNKGKNIFVEGPADKEFIAIEVLRAMSLGFTTNCALQLKEENIMLQITNIKDLTKRNDLERVRARIIGTKRKTLDCLEKLTQCNFVLHDNQVGVIGDTEEIEAATQALSSLIHGSKQSNVYARLERLRKKKRIRGKLPVEKEQ
jgi:ribosomal RNA assembly protein